MANKNLTKAKKAKNDEFYTQLSDIEEELRHYKKYFRDKVVFCNCDDAYESNFVKYFLLNFNRLGLKKFIATCYAAGSAKDTLGLFGEELFPTLTDDDGNEKGLGKVPYKLEVTELNDMTGDGRIDLDDVEYMLQHGIGITRLEGDGDFRSNECVELLKEADVVVTNPPFSLFREFIAQLIEYDKDFIVIGNQNAATYKEIFPLIKDGKMWWGCGDCVRWFLVPDEWDGPVKEDLNGRRIAEGARSRWFTNVDHKRRHDPIDLYKKYKSEEYPKYDNYNAIEVGKTSEIPRDYFPDVILKDDGTPPPFYKAA